MALTTCRECGRTGVSADWRAICPGCGSPNPGGKMGSRNQSLAVAAAVLVSLLGAAVAFLVARR